MKEWFRDSVCGPKEVNLPEVKAWTVVAFASGGKACGNLLVARGPSTRCSGMGCAGIGGKGGSR